MKSRMRRFVRSAGVGRRYVVAALCCAFAAPTLLVVIVSPAPPLWPADIFASSACSSLDTSAHAVRHALIQEGEMHTHGNLCTAVSVQRGVRL